ncbi:MAG: c-type cytochrome, partial [Pirellulaceae bacterium]|nr:c-type cytochrome [Pirellulaceae bacterium]
PILADNETGPEGFKVEKIFQVPRAMGSWVSLTTDPMGRLIACDQGGAGLYLITPGTDKEPTRVQKMPVALSGAHGLLWAFDSLYAMVNGGNEPGLHRLRDANGDGLMDTDEFCMAVPGSGEHGPHAIILSPDKQSLFVCAGNHTKLPNAISSSRIPQNWSEDHLLPRRWDANGHAAGILAPGGWICQVDPSGKNWDVVSMGYRNQYDIAFNADGELFTYDADMEWDFGSPWYRPTRVCHATSGSEFGWRSGTGKWPTYYEDSLPAAVDIGPGSPTGVVFGTGTKFPARYQKALFILDWTYSTIYSIDFTPNGSTYTGKKSDFITGSPLPVTDATVGPDGALYFAAGGRGTQSSLYRVTYVGTESTEQVDGRDEAGKAARELRRQLEAGHGQTGGDVALFMKHLGHEDRFIRYAARVALENQPVDKWRGQLDSLTQPKAIIGGSIALAHQGKPDDQKAILTRLGKLNFETLSQEEKLAALRAYQLAFTRLGEPSDAWRTDLVAKFDKLYPAKNYELNAELVQLLVYLQSPTVVEKTLALMATLGTEPIPEWGYLVARNANYGGTVGKMLADMPPVRGIHFAFVLRNAKTGWTLDQRRQYFQFFISAAKHPGGNSFGKFLAQFRDDAIATCSQSEKIVLEPLISASLLGEPFVSTPPTGPGRKWTAAEVIQTVGQNMRGRNFKQGQNLYHATSCSKCHRMAGEGGAIGPDLSTAAKKFSLPDLVDAIVEPSKAISDQYGSQQVVTADGQVLVGRAVEIGDEYYVYTIDAQAKPIVLKKDDVESIKPSKLSQMPVGLIDTLNAEELKDLMAYMLASGDPRAQVFK